MVDSISNFQDVIDSRDVIARIEELRGELETAYAEDMAEEGVEQIGFDDWVKEEAEIGENLWQQEASEYLALTALADEAEGYAPDWQYGATLIRESYFVDYCRELVSDIGDMPREIPHYIVIDWEATAGNIRVDYAEVDFDGVTYLVR
jgi:hypothetical protein